MNPSKLSGTKSARTATNIHRFSPSGNEANSWMGSACLLYTLYLHFIVLIVLAFKTIYNMFIKMLGAGLAQAV
jgi:hypothetical protein